MKSLSCEEIRRAIAGRWLRKGDGAATACGVSIDTRTIRPGEIFFAIRGERFDGHEYLAKAVSAGAAVAVVRADFQPPADMPLLPGGIIAVDDTARALGLLAAYHRGLCRAKVVAVTGSNGKTTVKLMIQHILSSRLAGSCSPKSFNNQIGVPLTLLAANASDDYVVCEVGSNAPGEIGALGRICRPDIAVITSIGPTHLEKLISVEGVAVEKASLLGELAPDGIGVVCDAGTSAAAPEWAVVLEKAIRAHGRPVIRFGEAADCQFRLTSYEPLLWHGRLAHDDEAAGSTEEEHGRDAHATHGQDGHATGGCRFEVNGLFRAELHAPGRHNAINALAAIAVAQRLGFDMREACELLAGFQGAHMRLQTIQAGPVKILNDAYNANPASMAAAGGVLGEISARRRVFVAGDMLELGAESARLHIETGRLIALSGADCVVGVGPMGRLIAEGASLAGARAEMIDSVEEAQRRLPQLLAPGDVVLVKGSRGMAMERLIEPIRSAFEPASGGAVAAGAAAIKKIDSKGRQG